MSDTEPAATPAADPADLAQVDTLLTLAGLPASDKEKQTLAGGYPLTRSLIASLWSMPEARYAEPALVFSADPPGGAWP